MIIPNDCPICHGELKDIEIYMTCEYTNHAFRKRVDGNGDIVWVDIRVGEFMATWYFLRDKKTMIWNNRSTKGFELPFIEPDFSNIPKLLDKLKTYLVFA